MSTTQCSFKWSEAQAAFERVKERSAGAEARMLAEEGGSADDAEFARIVGCSVKELLEMADTSAYVYIEYDGRRCWPRWQFHEGAPLPGLAAVLEALGKRGPGEFSIVLFFLGRTDTLHHASVGANLDVRPDDSPLALLRRCGVQALPLVLRHAQRTLAQGAT
jgi:hypothetical protein